MKNPQRPLRLVLDDLIAELVGDILDATRIALTEGDMSIMAPPTRRPREEVAPATRPSVSRAVSAPKEPRPSAAKAPPARAKVERVASARSAPRAEAPQRETATDELITDPMALLAALDTASPGTSDSPRERELPKILAPVAPVAVVAPVREIVPMLRAREGEQVLRSSGSSVVLRRRRA